MADEKRSFSRRRFLAGSALGATALTLGARRAAAQAKPTAPIASKSAAPRRDYEIHQAYATDTYGGFADLPVSGGGTGYFRLGQIGDRWTFVTPLGNAFLQKGIMVWQPVTPRVEPNIKLKYGDARTAGFYTPWALIRAARWGINTIGWGLGIYHFPVSFLNQGARSNSWAAISHAPEPRRGPRRGDARQNKDPVRVDGLGVKIAAWPPGGFRRGGCDMGDPHFTDAVQGAIDKRKKEFTGFDITTSPWLLANSDRRRGLLLHAQGRGFAPSRLVAAITAPIQNASSTGIVYDGLSGRTDGIVYMKQVLYRNYLQQKYKTIGALNAAWGSNYTTFGSSNPSNPLDGWLSGTGTGLMDEDGVSTRG